MPILNGRCEDIWTDVIMVSSVTNAQMAAPSAWARLKKEMKGEKQMPPPTESEEGHRSAFTYCFVACCKLLKKLSWEGRSEKDMSCLLFHAT
jgi:hypothetical protein